MGNKLYVGNLPIPSVTTICGKHFAYGNVASAKVVMERDTGRFQGFGFVEMGSDAAQTAIGAMNGQQLGGRGCGERGRPWKLVRPRSGGFGGPRFRRRCRWWLAVVVGGGSGAGGGGYGGGRSGGGYGGGGLYDPFCARTNWVNDWPLLFWAVRAAFRPSTRRLRSGASTRSKSALGNMRRPFWPATPIARE